MKDGSLRHAENSASSKPVRVMRLRYTAGMIWSVSTLLWRSGTPLAVGGVFFARAVSSVLYGSGLFGSGGDEAYEPARRRLEPLPSPEQGPDPTVSSSC